MNYLQTVEYIHSLRKFNKKASLDEIKKLMEKLECDYNSLKFFHVAGTNGKGSVSTMLSKIAEESGRRVGLFTSPYIVCFRERIRVNGEMIPEADLVRLSKKIIDTGISVKEFEFITALALLYFKEMNCDIVILEAGLGGKDDSTNIISSPLCSVITHIGLDHTAILGDTIEKIAHHKIGIAKENCPVVVAPCQPDEAKAVIRLSRPDSHFCDIDKTKIVCSDITGTDFIYCDENYRVNMAGKFQVQNALTAALAAKVTGLFSKEDIIKGIEKARVPARVEVVSKSPLVVIDGAHNPDGAAALESFITNISGKKTAVIGMMQDKDVDCVLSILLPYFDTVICTEVSDNPRAVSSVTLANMAKEFCQNVIAEPVTERAVERALNAGESVFVFGSLYLASEIRPIFIKTDN